MKCVVVVALFLTCEGVLRSAPQDSSSKNKRLICVFRGLRVASPFCSQVFSSLSLFGQAGGLNSLCSRVRMHRSALAYNLDTLERPGGLLCAILRI